MTSDVIAASTRRNTIGAPRTPRLNDMDSTPRPSRFWINWLSAVAGGVAVFGLILVVAPALTRQGFSLLVYASPGRIDAFGAEPARYLSLTHAVIGGVMVGWGTMLFYVTRTLFADGMRLGWNLIALSVAAWFVPDTLYSLASGFWQNAVLNVIFLGLFGIPLQATRATARKNG